MRGISLSYPGLQADSSSVTYKQDVTHETTDEFSLEIEINLGSAVGTAADWVILAGGGHIGPSRLTGPFRESEDLGR